MKRTLNIVTVLIVILSSVNLHAQNNDSIFIHLPQYGLNELHNTFFEVNRSYLGLYQKNKYSDRCKLIELVGNDTSSIDSQGRAFEYKKLHKVEIPEFVIWMDKIKPSKELLGRAFNNKMLFPGDAIRFNLDHAYTIYSKGKIVQNESLDQPPYSAIENYEIIIRKKDGHQVVEQTIFKTDRVIIGDLPYSNPGVYFQWIGDLNQDGNIDILFTIAGHHECIEVVFLLSSVDNKMVQEVYREWVCG